LSKLIKEMNPTLCLSVIKNDKGSRENIINKNENNVLQ